MCSPVLFAVGMGGLSALSTISSAESQRAAQQNQAAQMQYQASIAEQNAKIKEAEAKEALQLGEIEKQNIDKQRSAINAEYQAQASANRSLLSASGVEMSGSAVDWLLGNANAFSEDIGTNRYNRSVADWEAKSAHKKAHFESEQFKVEAQNAQKQASWLNKTSGSLGNSLLMGAVSGIGAGVGSYASAGGFAGV